MCEKHLLSTLCKDVSQIPATFASLSPSAQVLYRTLSYPKVNLRDPATVTSLHDHPEFLNAVASMATEDHVIIMAIHRVNAYGASDGSVICLEASRINHSCVPNVQHNWNSRLGALTIHAVRDIAAGEELLTAYIEPCRTADHRRQALNRYGFKCSCTACEDLTGHGKASSKRRSRVQEINRSICLYSLFPGLSPFRTNKQALHAVLEAIKLLEEEEIQTFQVLDRSATISLERPYASTNSSAATKRLPDSVSMWVTSKPLLCGRSRLVNILLRPLEKMRKDTNRFGKYYRTSSPLETRGEQNGLGDGSTADERSSILRASSRSLCNRTCTPRDLFPHFNLSQVAATSTLQTVSCIHVHAMISGPHTAINSSMIKPQTAAPFPCVYQSK